MATELERTLADALRELHGQYLKYRDSDLTQYDAHVFLVKRADAMWYRAKDALAAYDTAQSQPGDIGEAPRSGESGAAWLDPIDGIDETAFRESVQALVMRELFLRRPERHLNAMQWRNDAWDTMILELRKLLYRARELDAARDRGEARTAEGVGGGDIEALAEQTMSVDDADALETHIDRLSDIQWDAANLGENPSEDQIEGIIAVARNTEFSLRVMQCRLRKRSTPPAGIVTVPSNYVANKECEPTSVMFADDRIVRVVGDGYLEVERAD